MSTDVAFATCRELPEPDWDAQPLAKAVQQRGLTSAEAAWDDPGVAWGDFRLVVLRSTWNYYLHHEDFLRWVEATASVATMHNPPAVVCWNTHKRYLIELAEKGIAVVPTEYVPTGANASLAELLARRDWQRAVVKPAVSAASHMTFAMTAASSSDQTQFNALCSERDMLVQPFVASVTGYGERSVVVIDGEISHAVRKSPRFGGEDESVKGPLDISQAEADLALSALEAISPPHEGPLLYARVDMAPDESGAPMLMELELTEPSLFFDKGPGSAAKFASAIAARL